MAIRNGVTVRGVSNGNERGSAEQRRRRKEWLIETYRADVDLPWDPAHRAALLPIDGVPLGTGEPACRCYRCGRVLVFDTLTVDRITPGCVKTAKYPNGGTYVRENIRPACEGCQSKVGGALAKAKVKKADKVRRGHKPKPLIEVLADYEETG